MPKRIPPTTEAKVFNVAIGSVLKAERKRQRMEQKHLAKQIGVTYNQMFQFETGKTQFTIFKLHQVCRTLNVEITEMVERALELIAKTKEELKDVKQIESQ